MARFSSPTTCRIRSLVNQLVRTIIVLKSLLTSTLIYYCVSACRVWAGLLADLPPDDAIQALLCAIENTRWRRDPTYRNVVVPALTGESSPTTVRPPLSAPMRCDYLVDHAAKCLNLFTLPKGFHAITSSPSFQVTNVRFCFRMCGLCSILAHLCRAFAFMLQWQSN